MTAARRTAVIDAPPGSSLEPSHGGRAALPPSDLVLDEGDVTEDDLEHVVARIGEFGADNRAGIARTLHRISCIRNRKGRIVGVTCRVGRAVFGTIRIIEDLVADGRSILLLGRPGVGKTTLLREAGEDAVRAEPFDAVDLRLGRWWMPRSAAADP